MTNQRPARSRDPSLTARNAAYCIHLLSYPSTPARCLVGKSGPSGSCTEQQDLVCLDSVSEMGWESRYVIVLLLHPCKRACCDLPAVQRHLSRVTPPARSLHSALTPFQSSIPSPSDGRIGVLPVTLRQQCEYPQTCSPSANHCLHLVPRFAPFGSCACWWHLSCTVLQQARCVSALVKGLMHGWLGCEA